ncbi:hypothetical protein HZB60_02310 [candidate division KSB1 bacterium]|nr:hypothetical protein [candidate division KSB1 bacterium]
MNTNTLTRTIIVLAAVTVIIAGVLYVRRPSEQLAVPEDCSNCPGLALAAADTEPALAPDSLPVARSDSTAMTTIAYYFYTTQRCASCFKIETYSHEAIAQNFAADLKSGRLVWKMVNIDEPANEHFVEDYKLYTKALILVDYAAGTQLRWKNCQKVWELLNDKVEFQSYVKREVAAFLAAK